MKAFNFNNSEYQDKMWDVNTQKNKKHGKDFAIMKASSCSKKNEEVIRLENVSDKKIMTKDYEDLDLSDPKVLDSVELSNGDRTKAFFKFLIITALALFVFFVPVNGSVPFGIIYTGAIDIVESFITINGIQVGALLIVTIVLMGTGITSVIGKYFSSKESKMYQYYKTDSIVHPILYLLGGIFALLYFLETAQLFDGPELIVGSATGGMVIPPVVVGVAFIIPVGAFFIPFLTDYGCIDFFGVILEPLMRPFFRTPGKSAIDASASFVGSTTMGIIITGRMYNGNIYTKRESSIIATCFSAVSVGYAVLVMQTANLEEHFLAIYAICFFLTFVIAAIISRIPPISRKKDEFYDGEVQTEADRKEERFKFGPEMIKGGVHRATVRAHTSGSLPKRIVRSIVDAFPVLPKVITLLCSIGILGMIAAEYTPIFDIIGYTIYPITSILGVPDPMVAAAAIPAGITEMFIPVLTIAEQVDTLHIQTRFFVAAVSMLQIIFLAESVVVIMNTGLPVKFREMLVVFVQRTLIAMPLVAIFMHLMF